MPVIVRHTTVVLSTYLKLCRMTMHLERPCKTVSIGECLYLVSMIHVQALEPFFSVVLSALFLGDSPTLPVVLTLFPIVGGVAMASVTEVTFNWPGFLAAMGSNITFQSRNVLSKKFMGKGAKVSTDMLTDASAMWFELIG